MMGAEDVVEIMRALEDAGIEAWLDGGWGVDALVGFQSRSHDDLDLVVSLADVPRIEEALASAGWVIGEDARPTRVVLGDAGGRRIDLHTVTFDQDGGGIQELPEGRSYRYPPTRVRRKGVGCPRSHLLSHRRGSDRMPSRLRAGRHRPQGHSPS